MSKRFPISLLLGLLVFAPLANAQDSNEGGAPMEPPSWTWLQEVGDGHLTMTQDGFLAFPVTYPQYMEFEPQEMPFSVTVTDSEGAEVAGEATYKEGWYRLTWRQADGGAALAPGAELSAHIELTNHPDSFVDDIVEDVAVVVAAEPTPEVQPVEVLDSLADDLIKNSQYTCLFPRTTTVYRASDAHPAWMSSMLYYVRQTLDNTGEATQTNTRFPVWEGEPPTWTWNASHSDYSPETVLGESYCARITTIRMDDESSAMIESCVDAAAFDDLLEEGEVLCTLDNHESHRVPDDTNEDSPDDGSASSGGCGAAPTALPLWLLAIGLLFINRRRHPSLSGGP